MTHEAWASSELPRLEPEVRQRLIDALEGFKVARMVYPDIRVVVVDKEGKSLSEEALDDLELRITRREMERDGDL